MFKACPKCGKIHAYNVKCTVGVDYNKYKTNEDKLRNTYKWHRKSKQIRKDSQYLCAVCRDKGIYTYDKLEVHHITKLRDDTEGLLDDDNLICLCTFHHKQADKGELTEEYLRGLVKKRKG